MLKAHVTGRLIKDAEQKTAASGNDYAQAIVAAEMTNGETILLRLMAFGRDAERMEGAPKGCTVTALGNLELDVWQSNDGPKIGAAMLTEQIIRLGAKTKRKPRDSGAQGSTGSDNGKPSHSGPHESWGMRGNRKPDGPPKASKPPAGYEHLDDDLPF